MTWPIDPAHSTIQFSVRYMTLNSVRGRFSAFRGTLDLCPDTPLASQVSGEIDVTSINTGNAERDGHLLSADFFEVDLFPTIRFTSTAIEQLDDKQYRLHGELTIKAVTQPVAFDVTDHGQVHDPWGTRRWGFSAITVIDRRAFGLCWNIPLVAGGWVVGETVKIKAELQAVMQMNRVMAASKLGHEQNSN